MKASIVDLRYKMNDILKALKRNESVKILYHGKVSGIIVPAHATTKPKKVEDHSLFGMHSDIQLSVPEEMKKLRGSRYKDN